MPWPSPPLRGTCLIATLLAAACVPTPAPPPSIPSFRLDPALGTPLPTPTPEPTPTAEPPPTPTPTPTPRIEGQVLSRVAGTDRPLAGALVATTDGRSATTDAEGRFEVPGVPPADGVYTVSAPGHVSVTLTGVTGVPVVLRTQPVTTEAPARAPIVVTGRVATADGVGRGGVVVALADGRGAAGNPATTEADGRFSLVLTAPDRRVEQGTLLAVDGRRRFMGLLAGVQLQGPEAALDALPGTPALDPVRLVEADHEVRLSIDGRAAPVAFTAHLDLVGPNGASLPVAPDDGRYLVARLEGARYELRIEASSGDQAVTTVSRVRNVPLTWSAGFSVIGDTLLAPPAFADKQPFQPGALLRWGAIEGAKAYELELTNGAGYVWRALSVTNEAPFVFSEGRPPAGTYSLTLTAWDAPDLPAALQATPGRPVPARYEPTGRYRKATRRVAVTL
ncbi:MAG: carboxypeptidase-like regulatory domain-containing protein [Candidatus Sericytochromatia bacterium]|nr:carboxypeptidase-like regulatory domain-containing protein [Candidatus Sericytochromatia bacterium]